MKRTLFVTALIFLAIWSTAWADKAVESAQQKLKDGGFYYGEINGTKDADTTAAIRRYQIRNGLKITGELDAETLKSLGVTSKPATRPAPTPGPPPPDYPPQNSAPSATPIPNRDEPQDDDEGPPPPVPPTMQSASPFGGTPYEGAPPQVQQDIVSRVQIMLARHGLYRDAIDGLYGPALSFALQNYQARLGLEPTGRLDIETLALLRLLPEQQATGPRRFHRRLFAPRPRYWRDERIYIPR